MQTFRKGEVEVRWVGGALWVDGPGGAVLVEVPAGVAGQLAPPELARLRTVIVCTDRLRSFAGLLELCEALGGLGGARRQVQVLHPIDLDRLATVAQAWLRGWPDGVALELDAAVPGMALDLDVGEARFVPVTAAEPAPFAAARRPPIQTVPACAVAVQLAGARIVWLPGCRPTEASRRLVVGADLAVVEVGRVPWPSTDRPWRLSEPEAVAWAAGAREVWRVGDDGTLRDEPLEH